MDDDSVKLFENNDIFHDSYCVEKEFNKKYNCILKEQKNFLHSLKNDLINSSNIKLSLKNLKIKSKIISLQRDFDDNKKDKIVEVLWKFCESKHEFDDALNVHVCHINYLLNYINKFITVFERKLAMRRLDFEREVLFHSKRNEKYIDLNEKLLYGAEVHYPDNCIILDAHDLSLKENRPIEFITADVNMISSVNGIIDLLQIKKFHYLKDFVSNS